MIITCPKCQSRYEVARQALGNRGRKVECAQCHANWKALPEPEQDADDALFTADQEDELDAAFAREEEMVAPAAPSDPDPGTSEQPAPDVPNMTAAESHRLAGKRRALERRQRILRRQMPRARLRRAFRMAMAVALLTLLGGAWQWREPIVQAFPDLAGLYAAVGIDVNVIGLAFEDIETLRTTQDGVTSIEVSADLVNVVGRQVGVPPVLVSLVNAQEATIFEWSAVPQSRAIPAGEQLSFVTQLSSPPTGATHVRMTFVEGGTGNDEQDEARDGQE